MFLEFRGRSVLERFVSRIMQPRLVRRTSLAAATVGAVLRAVGDDRCSCCALMRPQWGLSVQRAVRVDSQIMICLDVSKSMLAEDVAPNRLERAKIELDSLLGSHERRSAGRTDCLRRQGHRALSHDAPISASCG